MKTLSGVLLCIFLIKFSLGQSSSIVGAWYWADSTKQTSMFFKQDGSMSMHSGPKGEAILTENLLPGTYTLTKNLLMITWADKRVEKDKIKFLDKDSLKITFADNTSTNKNHQLVFHRVVDEEISEEKTQ